MQEHTFTIPTPEGDITLQTGKIANLADGSVLVSQGGTSILAAVTVDDNESDQDFFPLTVEYLERYYAAGTLSGSRFNKREGFPSEDAITAARQVDHTIRPLFPKGFTRPVNVILTLMADDGETNAEALTVLAASAALSISPIPFAGPAASVVISVDEQGELHVNSPVNTDAKHSEFIVAAADGKLLNIEGEAFEVSEEQMDAVLDLGLERIAELNRLQQEFATEIGKEKMSFTEPEHDANLLEQLAAKHADFEAAYYIASYEERQAAISQLLTSIVEELAGGEAETGFSTDEVKDAADYYAKKMMRRNILEQGRRFSGRELEEIRELKAEVDILPSVHGSALFSRGYTQSLSIVTLGSLRKSAGFDELEGIDTVEPFLHHYNFPPFSTGETGRVRYKPGRREIGHGMIGQKGLQNIIANQDNFPYTIRAVSEIMTSNGSTSMAATCAASMALMAAGVPMTSAVAGIGVGLVVADAEQNDYKLVLDIEGVEDFFGDMDFKVTGTHKGITAIQFETKLQGVKPEIIKQAFRLSQRGRTQVLEAMNVAIAESRAELAPTAPRVEIVQIAQDQIGELIGPGGKVIKGIIEKANELDSKGIVEIDIDDFGKVSITADTEKQRDYVLERIKTITAQPELGEVYTAVVDKIMEYGAFVDVAPNISGLVHVSEIADERVNDVHDYLREGEQVQVKLIKLEGDRQSFSIKQVKPLQKRS